MVLVLHNCSILSLEHWLLFLFLIQVVLAFLQAHFLWFSVLLSSFQFSDPLILETQHGFVIRLLLFFSFFLLLPLLLLQLLLLLLPLLLLQLLLLFLHLLLLQLHFSVLLRLVQRFLLLHIDFLLAENRDVLHQLLALLIHFVTVVLGLLRFDIGLLLCLQGH